LLVRFFWRLTIFSFFFLFSFMWLQSAIGTRKKKLRIIFCSAKRLRPEVQFARQNE
jgi:hypothetical protein